MVNTLIAGNRVDLLVCGTEFFPALIEAIHGARYEIHLETYIFEDDETGHSVTQALCGAARRGVHTRVMVDGFGGRAFPDTMMPLLSGAGVEVLIYRPEVARLSLKRHRLRRLHRKLAVIDGAIGFVGGINIIDDMHTPGHTPPRFDYAVRIAGPLLVPLHRTTTHLWELVSWANFRHHHPLHPVVAPDRSPRGDIHAALVLRDNIRHRRDIEDAYLHAIHTAQREIVLANAYFLPGRRFRKALTQAARRGVKVVILLQGRVEYALMHYASQALYGTLLARGVEIHEYRRSFLHAKVAVVDDDWATVGSSNIDPFSLLLAREANVIVRDRAFTAQLRASLQQAMEFGGRRVRLREWTRRPLPERMARWFAYGLVRLLIGLAGERVGRHLN